jgi:trehalose/maltose transport system permease protein
MSVTTPKKMAGGGDSLEARQARLGIILLIPTFVVLILVAFYPLARTFAASFTDEPFARPEEGSAAAAARPISNVGFYHYQKLLSMTVVEIPEGSSAARALPRVEDTENRPGYRFQRVSEFNLFGRTYVLGAAERDFIASFTNTIMFTIVSVLLELSLGLGVAMVVNSRFRGRGVMRAVMLIPWAIPTAISTVLWRHMLGDTSAGAMNALLRAFGGSPLAWRVDYPLFSVVFVDVWKTVPYMALLLLAGLQTISGDLYEAASVDGATVRQRFWSVTVPLLMPTIVIALIFRTLDALRAFDVFQILLGRTTPSMAVFNYERLVSAQQYGYASAVGVVIFIIIFAFTVLYMRTFGRLED